MSADPEKRARILLRNRASRSLGKIRQAGYFYVDGGVTENKFRSDDFFSFVYLLEGSGVYSDASGGFRRLAPGDLFFTYPGLGHAYGPAAGDSWSEIFVIFEGPVFALWLEEGVLCPERAFFRLQPIAYWERRIRETIEWSRCPGNQRRSVAPACRLQQLLADILLTENRESEGEDSETGWVRLTARILEEERSVQVSWAEVAGRAGVSYETLRKRFVKHMGVSPGRYHIQCLMEHACRLLLAGRGNREIADTLGFCDEFHFSRRFKQIVGCSPRDFRNRRGCAGPRGGKTDRSKRCKSA